MTEPVSEARLKKMEAVVEAARAIKVAIYMPPQGSDLIKVVHNIEALRVALAALDSTPPATGEDAGGRDG